MEAIRAFRFPLGRDQQPLQSLSPERVNASRPASRISTKSTDDCQTQEHPSSSPTRTAKANLFADYHPVSPIAKPSSFALPQSPSLPEINALRGHGRANSDVQGLVKRFEHLDVRDWDAESMERRNRHEAELRRAQIAREEAESDTHKLREELRRVKKDVEDDKDRERKLTRRVAVVEDELAATKESYASQSAIYEKELRRARKEAFKSSSAVLKLQEELKSTRNTLRATQSGLDLEKQRVQRKEQERFEIEYQLIPLHEEVEQLKHKLNIAETERQALKTNLREEEVARIAAEGLIALPVSQDQDDDAMYSPRKQSPSKRQSPLSDDKENMRIMPKKLSETRELSRELEQEKTRRLRAEGMVEFMKMECLFQCCACKTSSRLGHKLALSLDAELAAGIEKIRESMEDIFAPAKIVASPDEMEVEGVEVEDFAIEDAGQAEAAAVEQPGDMLMTDQLALETGADVDSVAVESALEEDLHSDARGLPGSTDATNDEAELQIEDASPGSEQPSTPQPPGPARNKQTSTRPHPSVRTVTTTTTIPTHFTPNPKLSTFQRADGDDAEPENAETPTTPSFDRAAALAAIEYRRGRAKSIANGHVTPRKQMVEGVKERRDISAPALGQKSGMKAAAAGMREGPSSVGRAGGRRLG